LPSALTGRTSVRFGFALLGSFVGVSVHRAFPVPPFFRFSREVLDHVAHPSPPLFVCPGSITSALETGLSHDQDPSRAGAGGALEEVIGGCDLHPLLNADGNRDEELQELFGQVAIVHQQHDVEGPFRPPCRLWCCGAAPEAEDLSRQIESAEPAAAELRILDVYGELDRLLPREPGRDVEDPHLGFDAL
jgi:hypothetical protein